MWTEVTGSTAPKLIPIASAEEATASTSSTCWFPVSADDEGHLSWQGAFSRLEEFTRLPANWDSYEADPISPNALARAREILIALRSELEWTAGGSFMPENIVPVADGGVQFEWEDDGLYLEIELTAEGKAGYLLVNRRGSTRRVSSGQEVSTAELVRLVTTLSNVPALWRIS